jgi:hypothetical protein
VRLLSARLPKETTLIGFAGAPWTVATYMIAGRGTPDQAPAHKLRQEDPETFGALMDLLTEATIEYLDQQVQAGAEVVKIFDSWAGSLKGEAFTRFALEPANGSRPSSSAATPACPSSPSRGRRAKTMSVSPRPWAPTGWPSTPRSIPNGRRNTCNPTAACRATSTPST